VIGKQRQALAEETAKMKVAREKLIKVLAEYDRGSA
jgi:predicted RNA-binding protein with PIN domain